MDERERRRNKRRPRRRTEGSTSRSFSFYLLVLTAAVAAGYLTTQYALYPICIGGDPNDISLEKLIDEGIAERIEERLKGIINGDTGDIGDTGDGHDGGEDKQGAEGGSADDGGNAGNTDGGNAGNTDGGNAGNTDGGDTGEEGRIIEDGLPIDGQEQAGNGETPATIDSGGNVDGGGTAGAGAGTGAKGENEAATGADVNETSGQGESATPEQYVPENSGQQAIMPSVEGASGYCVQYGSFSTEEAADKLLKELASVGITAQKIKKDNAVKVVGQLFATKPEADAERQKQSAQYKDVFVISLS